MPKLATASLLFLSLLSPGLVHGGEEPAVQGEAEALPYLRDLHTKVHRLWSDNFLLLAEAQLPKDHPVNAAGRAVVLEVIIALDGKLTEVKVEKSSGASEFDTSAVDVLRSSAPFSPSPDALLSDDGKVHVMWTLARDDRRCSGLSITHRALPLSEAVRALVFQGREAIAISHLLAADDPVRAAGMDVFARAWLDKMENEPALAIDVAAANALAGDDRGTSRLREAAGKEPNAVVVRGLLALKIPLCPFVKDSLAKGAPPDVRERALWALGGAAEGECLTLAIASAKDRSVARSERLLALAGIRNSEAPEAKAARKELIKDADPNIKAAALLADARRDAGRGAVFRLIPLLRDKSLAVRAAAAAALVRVGGEEILPQLFQVFQEKDPAYFATLAPELGALSGEASAAMLGRFLRKDNLAIRLHAARALAGRRDEHAAKAQASLVASPEPELQLLAGSAVPRDKRDAALRGLEHVDFTASFAALARGQGRIVASDWLLANFTKLEPETRIAYLGEWLAASRNR